jgi:hypothetical protein
MVSLVGFSPLRPFAVGSPELTLLQALCSPPICRWLSGAYAPRLFAAGSRELRLAAEIRTDFEKFQGQPDDIPYSLVAAYTSVLF